jgi:Asp-tRNA(Asn)/Glu-tRNA(Gln) amidotransferase C subunit
LEDEFAKLDRLLTTKLIGPEVYAEKVKALGDALTDSVMTPAEKAAEKIAEYDFMLAKGAITQDTYNKLLAQTKEAVDALAGSSGFADFGRRIQELVMRGDAGPGGGVGGRFPGIGRAVPTNVDDQLPITDTQVTKFKNEMRSLSDYMETMQVDAFARDMSILADVMNQEQTRRDIAGSSGTMEKLLSIGNTKTDMLIAAVKNPPKQPMVLQ